MTSREFLKVIVEVHHILRCHPLQIWEEFEGLEKDVVNLGTISVGDGVVPGLLDMTMCGDDVVEACYNLVGQNHIVAAFYKEIGNRGLSHQHRSPSRGSWGLPSFQCCIG